MICLRHLIRLSQKSGFFSDQFSLMRAQHILPSSVTIKYKYHFLPSILTSFISFLLYSLFLSFIFLILFQPSFQKLFNHLSQCIIILSVCALYKIINNFITLAYSSVEKCMGFLYHIWFSHVYD